MSSHHSGTARTATISVPEGHHVALVLLQEAASSFYLQIPLNIIGSICRSPASISFFLGGVFSALKVYWLLNMMVAGLITWLTKGYTIISHLQA
jgi:hypothetical protein